MTATAPHSDEALESLYVAKNACSDDLPKLQRYLSTRAFAIGVQCFKAGHYRYSVSYLKEAFCLGKKFTDVNRQAHTLYLLGCAYLLWDEKEHWEKAVNALDMAIWHRPGVLKYMSKKLEALFQSGSDKQLSNVLDCILKHNEITIKVVLDIHQSLKKHGFVQQAIEFLQRAYIRFSQDGEALYLLVELLKAELDSDELDRASLAFQRILVQDSAKTAQLAGDCLKHLFRHLFCFGCSKAESGSISEAAEWLGNVETLVVTFGGVFSDDDVRDEVDSLRLCLVYWRVKLGMTNKAKETLEQYKGPDHTTMTYLRLKIALEEDNNADALAAVCRLLQLVKEANLLERHSIAKKVSGALIHAASYTLQAGKMDVAKDVLKQVASPPATDPAMAEMQLTSLQCVVALCLTDFDQNPGVYKEVADCIEKAAAILFVCDDSHWHTEQSKWFATVCWNLALQPEVEAEWQFRLFGRSFRLLTGMKSCQEATKRITTYALMALLSGVSASRKLAADDDHRHSILRDVHSIVEKLREVYPAWRENSQLAGLVLAADFEAVVHGGVADGCSVVDEILSLPAANAELLEGFVSICQEAGGKKAAALSVGLLRRCISLVTQNSPGKIIKFYHLLLQALLDCRDVDGLLACIDEVLKLHKSTTFPEIELVWMMTSVWNEGLLWYIEGVLASAKRCLTCAIRIVGILPELRTAYEQSLLSRYQRLFGNDASERAVSGEDHR
ncbi:hypothetical protein V5799_015636 [Amblyomma americanum]|uniref:Protein ZIP4 homolog n=1 Tax=Amblyomma americanum TaxID=6943 RepID=A0AAQ4F8P7_AMBAM